MVHQSSRETFFVRNGEVEVMEKTENSDGAKRRQKKKGSNGLLFVQIERLRLRTVPFLWFCPRTLLFHSFFFLATARFLKKRGLRDREVWTR